MTTAEARQLVQKTFQNPFDKGQFVYFIKNLVNEIDEEKAFHARGYVHEKYRDRVKTYERIGTYTDPEENKIDILIVYLQKESSIDRARTTLRNFVGDYLKERGEKEAGLIAFVSPNQKDWRFSLVKMEYKITETPSGRVKAKEEFTPAKRYSFLVGVEETSHTAQSRLVPILEDDKQNPTLKRIEEAFNIEKVTREFFEKYRDLYLRAKETLDDVLKNDKAIKADFAGKNIDTVDFGKKLLGQIVFLYFLQKKGWFGVKRGEAWGSGSKNFLRELFDKKHGDYKNFFNDILEPLFYEALRNDRSHDDHYFSMFKCKIPFLNGGLFDPINNYDWKETDVILPDDLFSNSYKTKEDDIGTGILDIFDRYNFTVKEDEPLEKEVAVDPEMLGKVFENLLEVKDRKSKGTYYTPREIVHYMCQESLVNYLATELDGKVSKKDIETLIKYGETVVEHEAEVESRGKETKTYSHKLSKAVRDNAKLIDEKLETIRICDPAVGSGAFPVGMMNEIIRTRNALTSYLKTKKGRTIYDFKRHAIQSSLYGVDIDLGAVEIAKLRLWLSLIVDEEDIKQIKPLPNLDYKVIQGNSLLAVEKNSLFVSHWIQELEMAKERFFSETNPKKKHEHKQKIDELLNQITNGNKEFDFEIYFSEVFKEKNGFDIVIANPPYVKEDVNKGAFDGLRNMECYQGKMDLWYLFGCKGLDILKTRGTMCFIATNNWVSNDGASKFRNKVIQNGRLIDFLDFGNYKVFAAGIQTMVYILAKDSDPQKYTLMYGRLLNDDAGPEIISAFLNSKQEIEATDFIKYKADLNRKDFLDTYIKFTPPTLGRILEKIKQQGNFNLQEDEIFSGIDVMQDFVSKSNVDKLKSPFKVGDGVFVISNDEKIKKKWNAKELSIIKPYYTTREIKRYYANEENKFWVLYTAADINHSISEYPNIKQHLDQFKKIITSANKPYGLHRTRDEKIFLGEKILSTRKCALPSFSYVSFPAYIARTFLIIKSNRIDLKFLLGILNSQLTIFWLYYKGKLQGNMFQIDKVPLQSVPIKNARETKQNEVISRVDKIISISKDNDYFKNSEKQAKVRDYEKQIDQLVYKLYGLTPEEIKIIESQAK